MDDIWQCYPGHYIKKVDESLATKINKNKIFLLRFLLKLDSKQQQPKAKVLQNVDSQLQLYRFYI